MPNKRLVRRLIIPRELMKKARPLMENLNARYRERKRLEKMLAEAPEHPGKYTDEELTIAEIILDFIRFLEEQSN